jgi:hypothetical protein
MRKLGILSNNGLSMVVLTMHDWRQQWGELNGNKK